MNNRLCDVKGCGRATYMCWRLLTESRGRQICQYHWRRHQDLEDRFDLFEAFGFRRPAGIRKPVTKKKSALCACGRELLPGHKFCNICANKRERKRKKQAYHERKSRPQQEPAEQEPILPCVDCGEQREPGHRYCQKCGEPPPSGPRLTFIYIAESLHPF